MNYYNENDPKAAAWIRELIKGGHLPAGDVDERSIEIIKPHEISNYTQQHFFAGIGGWSYALRLAGWPEDRPVRTGSCPCQPFSQSGKQLGVKDERHLWPVFRNLISFGEPTVTFGEQVASPLGREWLAGVRADLEGLGYEVGAADLCAACIGAPHRRQRLYWVANTVSNGRRTRGASMPGQTGRTTLFDHPSQVSGLVQPDGARRQQGGASRTPAGYGNPAEPASRPSRVGYPDNTTPKRFGQVGISMESEQETDRPSDSNAWSGFEVVGCADGKARRFEPGSFPLADGLPHRVGLLRGYGNAIVPQLAAEFICAFQESEQ